MRHGSLFSGIGGFDLAAEWMEWENIFHCEWNPFGQKVLKYYWPNSISYDDITKTDFTIHRGNIDILTGGFPCQPYSSAGKRKGKEDERHLWPQMLRAIREIAPTWVVGENVYGLVNWSEGLVFHEVQSDLEAEGYEVFPFLLPAVSVNAPHRRDRIWFVAYSNGRIWKFSKNRTSTREKQDKKWEKSTRIAIERFSNSQITPNSNNNGFNECDSKHEVNPSEGRINAFSNTCESNDNGDITNTKSCNMENKWHEQRCLGKKNKGWQTGRFKHGNIQTNWNSFPTSQPTICNGDDGLSDRLDSITFSKWRNESIKAGGNAIVPQVVYQIFKAIEQYERITTTKQDY